MPRGQDMIFQAESNWDYANSTPTGTWRGQQSIPRRLSLHTADGRPMLISTPVGVTMLAKSTTWVKPTKGADDTRRRILQAPRKHARS